MKSRYSSEGFVLVFSLVLALCAGLILAGTLGYVSYAARQSAASAARSSCRLAALPAGTLAVVYLVFTLFLRLQLPTNIVSESSEFTTI